MPSSEQRVAKPTLSLLLQRECFKLSGGDDFDFFEIGAANVDTRSCKLYAAESTNSQRAENSNDWRPRLATHMASFPCGQKMAPTCVASRQLLRGRAASASLAMHASDLLVCIASVERFGPGDRRPVLMIESVSTPESCSQRCVARCVVNCRNAPARRQYSLLLPCAAPAIA